MSRNNTGILHSAHSGSSPDKEQERQLVGSAFFSKATDLCFRGVQRRAEAWGEDKVGRTISFTSASIRCSFKYNRKNKNMAE